MFKSKLATVLISSSAVICVILGAIVVGANTNSNSFNLQSAGEISKDIMNKKVKQIIMVNNEPITDKDYQLIRSVNPQLSDEQIKDELICNKLVYKAAQDKGLKVSDSEVENFTKLQRESIAKDTNHQNTLKSYIKELGISEAQYWEKAKEEYKRILLINLYKDNLREEFLKTTNKDDPQVSEKFLNHYRANVKELKSKAKIDYLN